ncbi:hypothetical protein V2W45_1473207 [Cenococcum geophilum]
MRWPYTAADFARQESTSDSCFYSNPRFVTHIDDRAIATIRRRILDFCSSWISHYPPKVEEAAQRGGLKLSDGAEGRFVTDLNKEPDFSAVTNSLFDAATCVVSIDYLTQPREVLGSLRRVVKEGATVNVVVSNPCFPTKTIARWLKIGEEERLNMVADYLYFPGWSNVEIFMKWAGFGAHDSLGVVRGVNSSEREVS